MDNVIRVLFLTVQLVGCLSLFVVNIGKNWVSTAAMADTGAELDVRVVSWS